MRASAHRDLTKLPGTVDRGRFVKEDTMMRALVPSHGPLVGGLSSRSTKDTRLHANAKHHVRSITPPALSTGSAWDANPAKLMTKYSANAQRHAAMRAAKRGIKRPQQGSKFERLLAQSRTR